MSIYSGFATRQQQQTYDHCLNSLLYILQKRILKFYTNEKTDEYKFMNLVQKMYLQMKQMEKSKYLDPKCSYAIQELFQYLIKQNHTQQNATMQNDSIIEDSLKNRVISKKPAAEKQFYEANQANGFKGKQKTYQIPIRVQESKPRQAKIKSLNKLADNVGKIVSSKSKEKNYISTIENSRNSIRIRTPSANHGGRFTHNAIEHQNNRSIPENQGVVNRKPYSKSSARFQLQNDLRRQSQINSIVHDYIQKTKKSRILSSHSKFNRNSSEQKHEQQQKHFFTNKR